MNSRRVLIDHDPFPEYPQGLDTREFDRALWPAKWIGCPDVRQTSFVCAYRLRFQLQRSEPLRLHVSADQRYELFLDGVRIGRGPERGDPMHWFFETYELDADADEHSLVARVWTLDPDAALAPAAQMTHRHGFVLAASPPHTEALSTGVAPWEVKALNGYAFTASPFAGAGAFVGGEQHLDGGRYPWGCERGDGDGWQPVEAREPARARVSGWGDIDRPVLRPATLPPMLDQRRTVGRVRHVAALPDAIDPQTPTELSVDPTHHRPDEVNAWQRLVSDRGPHTVPPRTARFVLIDLDDYCCGYPELVVSGGAGARLRWLWAESLYEREVSERRIGASTRHKGNRDEVHGKAFIGRGDTFEPDGGASRTFQTLWWRCGRYVALRVETSDDPLTIEALTVFETRYPLKMEGAVELSERRFNTAVPIMWRTLQMCAHETYMDCPYYEQLMYTGDTRLEALVTYLCTSDDRLPRKAVELFGASQSFHGLTQARYPSHNPQVIPQFSLFWVGMVYDFALWRGDRAFVGRQMPRVRAVLESFIGHLDGEGLLRWPEGWNWVDWVPRWHAGHPPRDDSPYSGINQWQFLMIAGQAAELERWVGEPVFAQRLERVRRALARRVVEAFWDDRRGLFADTPSRDTFSEHAQCYALLSGLVDDDRRARVGQGLLHDPDLARMTIYARHYLFETFGVLDQPDAILDRLDLWYNLEPMGLKTTIESPEPARSDCHAWGAHPIYHALATLLGIRPGGLGFETVGIEPRLGAIDAARGTLCTPHGPMHVDAQRDGDALTLSVELPGPLHGEAVWRGVAQPLRPGRQSLRW